MSKPALIGKAGEALVAAELLRKGVDVAYPAYDGGIDLLAYRERNLTRLVPIQVKTRAGYGYTFHKKWFDIKGIVLVHVWHATTRPECYIFRSLSQFEEALGPHALASAWAINGHWHADRPSAADLERLCPHKDKWDRIVDQL
jgi:hypothetical protein